MRRRPLFNDPTGGRGRSLAPKQVVARNVVRSLFIFFWWGSFALAGSSSQRHRQPSEPEFDSGTASDEQIRWLVDSYGRLMFRVAFAITQNTALAEEVVQDTMVKAWTSIPSWDDDQPVRWLRTVAKNRAISVMRKESRSFPSQDWDHLQADASGPERVAEGRLLIDAVREAMADLDDESRTMVVLRETDEMSYDEIANLLGLTSSAVKAKLYRARHQLKTTLRDWED